MAQIFKNPNEQANSMKPKIQIQNPQAAITGGEGSVVKVPPRFTKRPRWNDYLSEDANKQLNDIEYYNHIKNFDEYVKNQQGYIDKGKKEGYNTDFNEQRLAFLLSDPKIKNYIDDRNGFEKQFEKDYNEYLPTAKEAILQKLVNGEGDLLRTTYYGPNDYHEETDDLYDSINQDFAKKYGYENSHYGDMFYPNRNSGFRVSPEAIDNYGQSIEGPNGSKGYRSRYNKNEYIAELLKSGVISLDDLRKLFGGK